VTDDDLFDSDDDLTDGRTDFCGSGRTDLSTDADDVTDGRTDDDGFYFLILLLIFYRRI
jgi:hypothetical protein